MSNELRPWRSDGDTRTLRERVGMHVGVGCGSRLSGIFFGSHDSNGDGNAHYQPNTVSHINRNESIMAVENVDGTSKLNGLIGESAKNDRMTNKY